MCEQGSSSPMDFPPLQRSPPAPARPERPPTRRAARRPAHIDGGERSPPDPDDPTHDTHDRAHATLHACVESADTAASATINRVGLRDPAALSEPQRPPTAWTPGSLTEGRGSRVRALHLHPRAPVRTGPPGPSAQPDHEGSLAATLVVREVEGHRGRPGCRARTTSALLVDQVLLSESGINACSRGERRVG